MSREIEKFFQSRPEVLRVYAAVGGFGGAGQVNTGNLFISMKPRGERGVDPELGHEPTQQDLMNISRQAMQKIPDVKASIQDLSLRGFGASIGFPIEFSVQGRNWEKLA